MCVSSRPRLYDDVPTCTPPRSARAVDQEGVALGGRSHCLLDTYIGHFVYCIMGVEMSRMSVLS